MSAQEARDRLAALLPPRQYIGATFLPLDVHLILQAQQAAALADRLAEGDEARAAVTRVEALCNFADGIDRMAEDGDETGLIFTAAVRRALDGEPS